MHNVFQHTNKYVIDVSTHLLVSFSDRKEAHGMIILLTELIPAINGCSRAGSSAVTALPVTHSAAGSSVLS